MRGNLKDISGIYSQEPLIGQAKVFKRFFFEVSLAVDTSRVFFRQLGHQAGIFQGYFSMTIGSLSVHIVSIFFPEPNGNQE